MSLVSIVTPAMRGRERLLLDRCIPSVKRQAQPIEHIIVSDPNPDLRPLVPWPIRFVEVADQWHPRASGNVGAFYWRLGCYLALGEYVGFLGDDDELRPDHVERHVAAMEEAGADFSVSRVQFVVRGEPVFVVGDETFGHCHLDSDGIMCRASALLHGLWDPGEDISDPALRDASDYRMVRAWRAAGLRGVFVGGEPTAVHHDGWAARMA